MIIRTVRRECRRTVLDYISKMCNFELWIPDCAPFPGMESDQEIKTKQNYEKLKTKLSINENLST